MTRYLIGRAMVGISRSVVSLSQNPRNWYDTTLVLDASLAECRSQTQARYGGWFTITSYYAQFGVTLQAEVMLQRQTFNKRRLLVCC